MLIITISLYGYNEFWIQKENQIVLKGIQSNWVLPYLERSMYLHKYYYSLFIGLMKDDNYQRFDNEEA